VPKLTKLELARLLPHQGAMCLLDAVDEWNAEAIVCRAVSHRDPQNPLRVDACLPAICGVEYAAQAMAVHGALVAPGNPRAGMLAGLRDVRVFAERLDDIHEDLSIGARKLISEGERMLYEFVVQADARVLLTGRSAVFLDSERTVARIPA
jgi:predicted hotdog family 3-hydroxylacyl-ACP dehydratase